MPDASIINGAYTYTAGSSSVSIAIAVDGYPPPSVNLLRDDLSTIDNSKVMLLRRSILLAGPLNRAYTGNYLLLAHNRFGETTTSFAISIQRMLIFQGFKTHGFVFV